MFLVLRFSFDVGSAKHSFAQSHLILDTSLAGRVDERDGHADLVFGVLVGVFGTFGEVSQCAAAPAARTRKPYCTTGDMGPPPMITGISLKSQPRSILNDTILFTTV